MGVISNNGPSKILILFVGQVYTSVVTWYFMKIGRPSVNNLGSQPDLRGIVYHSLLLVFP